jgi:bifunctional oligoribonuclease and PAP phosphatase NrnA
VAQVAKRFGGGGHVRAAGCRLEAPLEEAVIQLVTAVRNAMEEA